jgi:hypothetical protein
MYRSECRIVSLNLVMDRKGGVARGRSKVAL